MKTSSKKNPSKLPEIGVFWCTDRGSVWKISTLISLGTQKGHVKEIDISHDKAWSLAVFQYARINMVKKMFNHGYDYLDRGKVVFNIYSGSYEIFFANHGGCDENIRSKIINSFNLNGQVVTFYGRFEYDGYKYKQKKADKRIGR